MLNIADKYHKSYIAYPEKINKSTNWLIILFMIFLINIFDHCNFALNNIELILEGVILKDFILNS